MDSFRREFHPEGGSKALQDIQDNTGSASNVQYFVIVETVDSKPFKIISYKKLFAYKPPIGIF